MRIVTAALLSITVPVAGFAQTSATQNAAGETFDAAKAFGAREHVGDISLSPNGQKIAYVTPMPNGQGNALMTIDLSVTQDQQKIALSTDGAPLRINQCDWVSDSRLICTLWAVKMDEYGLAVISRLLAVNADGTEQKIVSVRQGANAHRFSYFGGRVIDLLPGDDGSVLVGRQYAPESKTGSNIVQRKSGYGVDRVDTSSLKVKPIEPARDMAESYVSDGKGNVRIMGLGSYDGNGYDTGKRRYQYRMKPKSDWQLLGRYDTNTESGFVPVAVDATANAAYGFEERNGLTGVYKVALDGSLAKTEVFSRKDVDVDDLIMLGRQRKVVGVSYATEKRQAVYFDPAIQKLQANLSKALGGNRLINMVGLSSDESQMIVWAGSDTDPGQYYLLDRNSKQMSPLLKSRPQLDGVKLAEVKSVSVKAGDGTMVPAYLTLPPGSSGKNLPSIIMPHGGPSSRDEWGFDWLAQFFANRGYAVLQPNYRGSSGYGDNWYRNNGFKSWKIAVGDVNDSGRWLVSEGIADPSKLAVFGWSYGGYAALQSAVLDPNLFKAIVAVAPVTDLDKVKEERRHYSDYKLTQEFVGTGPHIAEGSPARHAASFIAPVLMFHGDQDMNVGVAESKLMADALKDAGKKQDLVIYKGLDHYLEDSAVRSEMLAKSDAFIKAAFNK